MTISEQQSQAFKDFERTGWGKQAEYYDSLVGAMTRQAVDGLLAAVNNRAGIKLLDVASGPGYVAVEAAVGQYESRLPRVLSDRPAGAHDVWRAARGRAEGGDRVHRSGLRDKARPDVPSA